MSSDRKTEESLRLYREMRHRCLEQLSGPQDTSVAMQLRGLFFYDGVFRMLNEARRLEPGRDVSSAAWRLATAGYVSLLTTGIRRLIDDDRRVDSLARIIAVLRNHAHLLTRRHYVAHAGDPYDWQAARDEYMRDVIGTDHNRQEAVFRGHIPWMWSQMKHAKFDAISDGGSRRPSQRISPSVLDKLSDALKAPALCRIKTYTDKAIAHAERLSDEIERPTYDDIDESLKTLCQIRNFISTVVFFDSDHSQTVPTPQFNIAEHLDVPLALSETTPALQDFWKAYARERNGWSSSGSGYDQRFLTGTHTSSSALPATDDAGNQGGEGPQA